MWAKKKLTLLRNRSQGVRVRLCSAFVTIKYVSGLEAEFGIVGPSSGAAGQLQPPTWWL